MKKVNEKAYHWCAQCCDCKGLWAPHKEADHKSNFRPPSCNGSKKLTKKAKVAFTSDTKTNDGPKIQVNKNLLLNAKAFLTLLKDFWQGDVHQD